MLSNKMRKMLGISACVLIVALDITAWILAMKAKKAQNHVSFACYMMYIFIKGNMFSHVIFLISLLYRRSM